MALPHILKIVTQATIHADTQQGNTLDETGTEISGSSGSRFDTAP
jgi:hypothetical protein